MIKIFKDNNLIFEHKWPDNIDRFLKENGLRCSEVVIEKPEYILWKDATQRDDDKRYVSDPYLHNIYDVVDNKWLTRDEYDELVADMVTG